MSSSDVVVIDYGAGNLLSVYRGLVYCGANVTVTSEPQQILSANRVILPGVGAFADAMNALSVKQLDHIIKTIAHRGTPLLGICLGMQMLLDESEEFGLTAGLSLIPGRVLALPKVTADGQRQKIPHIGWNELLAPQGRDWQSDGLLSELQCGDSVYFVHSFAAHPIDTQHRVADCTYGDHNIAAILNYRNIWGCQFHPEKSGKVGLKILDNFLRL